MKKYIISFNRNDTTYYVCIPFWYRISWGRGDHRKRLGYHLTIYRNMAHKFIKRRNIRLIMNDIALRYKENPIMAQV
jgi:hypothetical protein